MHSMSSKMPIGSSRFGNIRATSALCHSHAPVQPSPLCKSRPTVAKVPMHWKSRFYGTTQRLHKIRLRSWLSSCWTGTKAQIPPFLQIQSSNLGARETFTKKTIFQKKQRKHLPRSRSICYNVSCIPFSVARFDGYYKRKVYESSRRVMSRL